MRAVGGEQIARGEGEVAYIRTLVSAGIVPPDLENTKENGILTVAKPKRKSGGPSGHALACCTLDDRIPTGLRLARD